MLMHSKLHNLNIADAKLHQRHLLTACRNYRTFTYSDAQEVKFAMCAIVLGFLYPSYTEGSPWGRGWLQGWTLLLVFLNKCKQIRSKKPLKSVQFVTILKPILSLIQALPKPVTKRQRKLSVGLNWCLEKSIHHLGWAMMKNSKNTYTISCWVSKEMMNFCPIRNKDFPYLFMLVKQLFTIWFREFPILNKNSGLGVQNSWKHVAN